MAFIEISELQETLNIDNNSVFPVVFQGETKKVTFATLKSAMQYFNAVSFNSSTGQFVFGMSNGSDALLNTDFNDLIKDVELLDGGKIKFTREDDTEVEITIPAGDLSNYYTKTEIDTAFTNYYNKTEIDNMIGDINSILDNINGEVV